ncbi:hypothetical protein [Bosea sp. 124]|uniref:hypothetical protein n=1 Tax=Bosea sp. 124 TaxID=2135642 RepID=UPI000D37B059|nr:hypothetical protein [Bosea sp. 124]
MRHGIPSISGRRRRGGAALWRLAAALAVMLLAVLPHATLAASSLHATAPARSPAMAKPHAHHGAHQAQSPAPCHDDDSQPGKAGPSMPSCCILGCGLLGSAPALDVEPLTTGWQRLILHQARAVAEAGPEPAERPPRRAAP